MSDYAPERSLWRPSAEGHGEGVQGPSVEAASTVEVSPRVALGMEKDAACGDHR